MLVTELELNEQLAMLLYENPNQMKQSRRLSIRKNRVEKNDRLMRIIGRRYIPHAGYIDYDMLIARKPIDEYTNTPDFRKNVRFTGVCGWDGKELLSLDGDDYDIDEEILGYYFQEEDFLVYWY